MNLTYYDYGKKKYSFDERYIAHRAICKYENVGVYASFVIAWIFGTTVCFNWIWFVVSPPPFPFFLSLPQKSPNFQCDALPTTLLNARLCYCCWTEWNYAKQPILGENDASTHNGPEFRIFMFKTLFLKICSIFNGILFPNDNTQRQSLLVLDVTMQINQFLRLPIMEKNSSIDV